MTKPLSEMLEEFEFDPCDYESIRTFDRMKRVAIELAKALEIGAFHHQACDANWYSEEVDEDKVRAGIPDPRKAKHCTCARIKIDQAIDRAKDIIGGE